MTRKDWGKLQNGSDIRGVAMAGKANERVNFTPEVATTLGRAFAHWLRANNDQVKTVAVGMDPRQSGPMLQKALVQGLCDAGLDVVDCGLASTPAMFMTTSHPDIAADGAIMLTASHLPFNRNGLKFFTRQGGFDKRDIKALLDIAAAGKWHSCGRTGTVRSVDWLAVYAEHLVATVRRGVKDPENYDTPLAGTKIIVDAGNGAGGFFADKVLQPLGADTRGSLFLEPDGRFPNHVPNPEDPEAIAAICAAVVEEGADLGIIFDTDVDRAAIVDENGQAINRNKLIALVASVVLAEHPYTVIVTDSITSTALKTFIVDRLGGIHHRFRRGYKNVIDEAVRLNAEGQPSWLAIETSGHAALKENHFLDDGAYLVSKLLIQMAKMVKQRQPLTSLIANLAEPAEEKEFRLAMLWPDHAEYGQQVLTRLATKIAAQPGWTPEEPNYEGLRIRCDNPDEQGWFLLRMSLHDPVMPLNVESDRPGGVGVIAQRLRELLTEFEGLNLSGLSGE